MHKERQRILWALENQKLDRTIISEERKRKKQARLKIFQDNETALINRLNFFVRLMVSKKFYKPFNFTEREIRTKTEVYIKSTAKIQCRIRLYKYHKIYTSKYL